MIKKKIVYCTKSNLLVNKANVVNDLKFIQCIPKKYNASIVYYRYFENAPFLVNMLYRLKYEFQTFLESIKLNNVLIFRNTSSTIFPFMLKPLFKLKIISYLACTPIMEFENRMFKKNQQFSSKESGNVFQKLNPFEKPFMNNFIQRLLTHNSDYIIIENQQAKDLIIKYGAAPSKVVVIPYYVNSYFNQIKNPNYHKDTNEPFRIGYTGQFRKYDDIKLIIDCINLLLKSNRNVQMVFIGDGETKKENEKYVKHLHLEKSVIFKGFIPHKQVAEKMNNFHCIILPMVPHQCPTTIAIKTLEGVMSGKIIISNNAGNNRSLFEPYYDLIIDKISVEDMYNKIVDIMENYEKYIEHAKSIKSIQNTRRSKKIFYQRLKSLLDTV